VSRRALPLCFLLISNLFSPVFAQESRNPGQQNPGTDPKPKPPADTPPPDTSQAKREGEEDGLADGRREAEERAYEEGRAYGRRLGYRNGYDFAERERRAEEYQTGFSRGTSIGTDQGERDGEQKGNEDGDRQGLTDGDAQGQADATAEATRTAVPPARAKGIREAEAETAKVTEQARNDAIRRADSDAQAEAERVDYKRGRDEYRAGRYAEPTKFLGTFSQRRTSARFDRKAVRPQALRVAYVVPQRPDIPDPDINARPDNRYRKPRRTYEFPVQNEAYGKAYNGSYPDGWRRYFRDLFIRGYRLAYLEGWDTGRYEARNNSYTADRDRGYEEGRQQAYQKAFSEASARARDRAYARAFENARATTYGRVFPGEYERIFEETRRAAYAGRVKEIYDAAYAATYTERYSQTYAVASREQYARGRRDEADVFNRQPVRVTDIRAVGALEDGVIEPNETVRLTVRVRNFSKQTIRGSEIRLLVQGRGLALDEFDARPVADLGPESEAEFTETFAIRFPEAAAGFNAGLTVRANYNERESDTQGIEVPVRYVTVVKIDDKAPLAEGIARTVTISVRNISSKPLSPDAILKLSADTNEAEIAERQAQVGGLGPGESRTLNFTVTARTPQANLALPLAVNISGDNRKLGSFVASPRFNVTNPYRIVGRLTGGGLRAAGTGRVEYTFRNDSATETYHGLQLRARVISDDPGSVEILGPNTQYLTPLGKSRSASFVLPMVVRKANTGGIIELELLEDGVPVVIHRMNF
jgi:hypothetical protein